MILGVMLWAGVIGILVLINTGISSKPDPGFALKIFALLTALGIAASLLPTIIGAKVLSIWLEQQPCQKISRDGRSHNRSICHFFIYSTNDRMV